MTDGDLLNDRTRKWFVEPSPVLEKYCTENSTYENEYEYPKFSDFYSSESDKDKRDVFRKLLNGVTNFSEEEQKILHYIHLHLNIPLAEIYSLNENKIDELCLKIQLSVTHNYTKLIDNINITEKLLNNMLELGYAKGFLYLNEKSKIYNNFTLNCVIRISRGNLKVIDYFHKVMKCPYDKNTFFYAVKYSNANLEVIKYFNEVMKCSCDRNTFCNAVNSSKGNLEVIKYFHKVMKCGYDEHIIRDVIRYSNANLEIIKYFHEIMKCALMIIQFEMLLDTVM